jgi:hypothetical protein
VAGRTLPARGATLQATEDRRHRNSRQYLRRLFDGSGGGGPSSVGITVRTGDIAVMKNVDNPHPSRAGREPMTATSRGILTTTGIAIRPVAGGLYKSHTASHGDYTSGTGTWVVGTLTPSESATLAITARVGFGTAGSTIENTASLSAANQIDLDPTNDTSLAAIVPVAAPSTDLALTKSVDDLNPDEGDSLSYTVTVTNLGPSTGTGIEVLIAATVLDYVSSIASQGGYDAGTGIWSIGALGVSNSATLTLVSTLDIGARVAVVANVAAIRRADQSDPVASNDTARVDIRTVQAEPLPIGTSNVLPERRACRSSPSACKPAHRAGDALVCAWASRRAWRDCSLARRRRPASSRWPMRCSPPARPARAGRQAACVGAGLGRDRHFVSATSRHRAPRARVAGDAAAAPT